MKLLFPLIWTVLLLNLVACKKAEDRRCLKFSGDYTERTLPLEAFNRLDLREHIHFVLIQDSTNQLIIKGGKNLLSWVEVTQDQGLVTVSNRNRCNYLRKYAIPTVEIHVTNLINILYQGTETCINEDTLTTNYLTLTFRDGGGSMDLNVKALDIKAENTHGWGNLVVQGVCQTFRANLMGDGAFDARKLTVTNALKIITVSSRDQWFYVQDIPLSVQIEGIGNVRYLGHPSGIFLNKYGKGDLIDAN